MTRDTYAVEGNVFFVIDQELGIDLKGELEFLDQERFPTGEVRYETYRKEEKLHGPSFFYHKEGQLLSEAWFYEGRPLGKVRRYYPTGELYSVERYAKGVLHLLQEYFYLDGSPKTRILYCKGLLDGKTELFWPGGMPKRVTVYAKGKRQSDHFYDEQGEEILAP